MARRRRVWRETLPGSTSWSAIDRQLTADAAYADIVLPATTMFEIDSYMVYGPIFRLREKLIEPVGEARNDYLIMAELARGWATASSTRRREEELLRYVLDGLRLHARGGARGRRHGAGADRR